MRLTPTEEQIGDYAITAFNYGQVHHTDDHTGAGHEPARPGPATDDETRCPRCRAEWVGGAAACLMDAERTAVEQAAALLHLARVGQYLEASAAEEAAKIMKGEDR